MLRIIGALAWKMRALREELVERLERCRDPMGELAFLLAVSRDHDPEWREDWRMGQICAAIVNSQRKSESDPVAVPGDYMLRSVAGREPQDPDEMEQQLERWARRSEADARRR